MRRRLSVPLAAVCAVVLLVGCGSGSKSSAPRAPSPSLTPTPSAAPSPTLSGDPLTGAATASAGPVVGVKVDNERLAWPFQRGLDRAAIVYQELIEGGATRLLAVFEGPQDEEIGPVRSVRASDAELVAQYGPFVLAFSGGNTGVLRTIAKSSIVNGSYDVAAGAYRIGEHRPDANNFYVRISALLQRVHGGSAPRDIGLRFGPPPPGGAPVTSLLGQFSAGVSASFSYDPAAHSWAVEQSGHPMTLVGGGRAAPQNVIVQMVSAAPDQYVDILGHRTPYTHSVGSGSAVVFRDGMRIDGTWTRPNPAEGTHFRDKTGADIPLRPGQTWILLLPTGQPLTAK